MSQQLIHAFAAKHNQASKYADLKVGMTVRVHQRLKAGEKGKNQIFEGIIIARKHGDEPGATMTVRRTAGGYGVEKVYPLRLPSIEKIEVVKEGRTRRAKMYYLRDKTAKEIRRKTRAEAAASQNTQTPDEPVEEKAE
jgi:large subunit ribosomal protein L19